MLVPPWKNSADAHVEMLKNSFILTIKITIFLSISPPAFEFVMLLHEFRLVRNHLGPISNDQNTRNV